MTLKTTPEERAALRDWLRDAYLRGHISPRADVAFHRMTDDLDTLAAEVGRLRDRNRQLTAVNAQLAMGLALAAEQLGPVIEGNDE